MRQPRPILLLTAAFVALAALAQVVPFYTEWLWFDEVGFSSVFWAIVTLRGTLLAAVALGVVVVLYGNLSFAARAAQPDVYWELED
ncbi:MAG TPA: UPF0182 family protein, partial [Candidatus Tectomicrobia bacterium]|nr:UPF0182 family protein [Candidatus Tectomicrobia bacterium]